MADMDVVNIPTMIDMITHIGVGMHEPLMFWGQPGAGKSEGVHKAAKQHDADLCDIRLSQYDSVDLRGIPVPSDDLTVWHAPSTLPFKGNSRFNEDSGKPIFLFLDEINSAAPATAAVAYQLTNDRAVGEHKLMNNVVIVCAGNREGDRGVTNRMPTPLANRLVHAEIEIDVDAWCYWAQEKGLPAVGIAFMQFRRPLISTFDPEKKDKAFATPRSWEKALRFYASTMPAHVKQAGITGAVGAGPAAEFHAFVDVWQKMTPIADIMRDPNGTEVPREASLRYATAVAVSGAMDKVTADPLNTYLERMDPEFTVLAWHLAIKRAPEITMSNAFVNSFAKKYHAMFKAD